VNEPTWPLELGLTFGIDVISRLCRSYGPKGQDNLAQGLPWVLHYIALCPEGAEEILARDN
jgi:hypothetical protein